MVTVPSLLLPILLSAVLVFLLSFVIHMVLPHHRSDFKRLPAEDQVMDALRPFDIPPGSYIMPHAGSPEGTAPTWATINVLTLPEWVVPHLAAVTVVDEATPLPAPGQNVSPPPGTPPVPVPVLRDEC